MWARLRTPLVAASLFAVALSLFAWAALAVGLAGGFAEQTTDAFYAGARADHRIVIVAVDRAFARTAERNPTQAYIPLVTAVAAAQTDEVVPEADVLKAIQADFTTVESSSVANEAIASAFRSLGDVLFPVVSPRIASPRPGSAIPTLDRAIPSSMLAEASAATGVDTVYTDSPDAALRRIPLLVEATRSATRATSRPGTLIPSLALLAWGRAERVRPRVVERDDGLEVGGRFIPTEGDQELRVNYSDALLPGGMHVISASDLASGKVPTSRLRHKLVFFGATEPVTATRVATPVGGRLPSVFVQANAPTRCSPAST